MEQPVSCDNNQLKVFPVIKEKEPNLLDIKTENTDSKDTKCFSQNEKQVVEKDKTTEKDIKDLTVFFCKVFEGEDFTIEDFDVCPIVLKIMQFFIKNKFGLAIDDIKFNEGQKLRIKNFLFPIKNGKELKTDQQNKFIFRLIIKRLKLRYKESQGKSKRKSKGKLKEEDFWKGHFNDYFTKKNMSIEEVKEFIQESKQISNKKAMSRRFAKHLVCNKPFDALLTKELNSLSSNTKSYFEPKLKVIISSLRKDGKKVYLNSLFKEKKRFFWTKRQCLSAIQYLRRLLQRARADI